MPKTKLPSQLKQSRLRFSNQKRTNSLSNWKSATMTPKANNSPAITKRAGTEDIESPEELSSLSDDETEVSESSSQSHTRPQEPPRRISLPRHWVIHPLLSPVNLILQILDFLPTPLPPLLPRKVLPPLPLPKSINRKLGESHDRFDGSTQSGPGCCRTFNVLNDPCKTSAWCRRAMNEYTSSL